MFIWQLGKQEYQDVEASNAKVVLPYDLSVPGVRVLPKGNKYSQKGVFIDACSGALALPETDPVTRDSSFPGMRHDWLLDLHQIVNNRQLSIMISEQVEVLLSYMIDLKVSEDR